MRFELALAIVLIVAVSVVLFTIVESNSPTVATTHENNSIAVPTTMDKSNSPTVTTVDESKFPKAPDLVGITGYVNTTPEELQKEMKGKVILYNFWTWSCINCVHEIPYVNAWYEKYANKGLLVIGVHTPESASVADPSGIKAAVLNYGIKYPVVLDTNWDTWNAFGNHWWPRAYLADSNGHIIYNHIGEGDYDVTEKEIQDLLAERTQSQ